MSKTKNTRDVTNQNYLKDWDDFNNKRKKGDRFPILLPINIDIVDGKFVRERMTAPQVKKLYADFKGDLPDYMFKHPDHFANPKKVFTEYVNYFSKQDGVEGPRQRTSPTPLDIECNRPTWLLFNLTRSNWKFSKGAQYSTENDSDDQTRNFEKICTMKRGKCLLLSNRHRSSPKGLKFNLHVTISQREGRTTYKTPIIIDPGLGNPGGNPP